MRLPPQSLKRQSFLLSDLLIGRPPEHFMEPVAPISRQALSLSRMCLPQRRTFPIDCSALLGHPVPWQRQWKSKSIHHTVLDVFSRVAFPADAWGARARSPAKERSTMVDSCFFNCYCRRCPASTGKTRLACRPLAHGMTASQCRSILFRRQQSSSWRHE